MVWTAFSLDVEQTAIFTPASIASASHHHAAVSAMVYILDSNYSSRPGLHAPNTNHTYKLSNARPQGHLAGFDNFLEYLSLPEVQLFQELGLLFRGCDAAKRFLFWVLAEVCFHALLPSSDVQELPVCVHVPFVPQTLLLECSVKSDAVPVAFSVHHNSVAVEQ